MRVRVSNGLLFEDHWKGCWNRQKYWNNHPFDEEFIKKHHGLIPDYKSETFNLKILLIGGPLKKSI